MTRRCEWARSEPSLSYHDTEWGVPLHDDRGLFEFLILEGAQAGLSWETILLLCLHAGGGHGQRPQRGLLPIRGDSGNDRLVVTFRSQRYFGPGAGV